MASSSSRPGSSSNQATVILPNNNFFSYSNKQECRVHKRISSSTSFRVKSQPSMLKLEVTASWNNKCQKLNRLAVWLKMRKLTLKTQLRNSSLTLTLPTSSCRRRLTKSGLSWTGRLSRMRRKQLSYKLWWRVISWETLKSKDLNVRSWVRELTHREHWNSSTRR